MGNNLGSIGAAIAKKKQAKPAAYAPRYASAMNAKYGAGTIKPKKPVFLKDTPNGKKKMKGGILGGS